MSSVGILDISLSNLGALQASFRALEAPTILCAKPRDLDFVDRVVIGGVGNFREAMTRLDESGMLSALRNFAKDGKPILGICLGMQLLAEEGNEGGVTEGLGLISGSVVPLDGHGVRVPHVGWNDVEFIGEGAIFEGLESGTDFYFVHNYILEPGSDSAVLGKTTHGQTFASVVADGHVWGVQFHPEKSHKQGRAVLRNFLELDPRC